MDGMAFGSGDPSSSVAGAGPRYELDFITPNLAGELLQGRRPRAAIRQEAISAYAEAMRSGRWLLNGMPIILAPNGDLLDGVQRLRACIVADTAFPTLIARDVPAEVLHTIDRQRRRSYAGTLGARGIRHGRSTHAALVKLIRYDEEALGRPAHGTGWGGYDRLLAANPEISEAVQASCRIATPALHEAVRSPLIYLGQRFDPPAVTRLLAALSEPTVYNANEPGAQLRRRLEEARDDRRGRLTSRETLALALMARRDTSLGRTPTYYRWRDGRDPFPVLASYGGLKQPEPIRLRRARGVRAIPAQHLAEGITLGVETISPAIAARYLEANRGNRIISRLHTEAIARDIAAGRWMLNAQPICFSADGRLLNGQHRLTGVLKAGLPIDLLVLRGLSYQAWVTYDQHARRGMELAEPRGFGDVALVAAAVTHLWRRHYRAPETTGRRPTAAEQSVIMGDYPAMPQLRTWARQVAGLMRPSVALYVAARLTSDDAGMAPTFLAQLRDGDGLSARHPILRLRARLVALRTAKARADAVIEAVMAAWHSSRHG